MLSPNRRFALMPRRNPFGNRMIRHIVMNAAALRNILTVIFVAPVLGSQPLAAGAELPALVAAQCHISKYYVKPVRDNLLVDQGTSFYRRSIRLSRQDRRQPFAGNIPAWVGSRTIGIEDGYAVKVTVDFMRNEVLGDFVQPNPAIAMDVKLSYRPHDKRVLSSTTARGDIVDGNRAFVSVSAAANDAELETVLADAGITVPSPFTYGSGFRYWAAIRDHFGQSLDFRTFSAFLEPLDRVANLVVPSVSVTCSVRRPGW
jgi:hypothetical protein